ATLNRMAHSAAPAAYLNLALRRTRPAPAALPVSLCRFSVPLLILLANSPCFTRPGPAARIGRCESSHAGRPPATRTGGRDLWAPWPPRPQPEVQRGQGQPEGHADGERQGRARRPVVDPAPHPKAGIAVGAREPIEPPEAEREHGDGSRGRG